MKVVREKPTGSTIDILVCGELMTGILSGGVVYIVIDVHANYSGGYVSPESVKIWRRGKWLPCRYGIAVFDRRPLIKYS